MVDLEQLLSLVLAIASGGMAGLLLSILTLFLKRRSKERKEMVALVDRFGIDQESIKVETNQILESEAGDKKAAFVILVIDIERRLRQFSSFYIKFERPLQIQQIVERLIERGVLDNKWRESFRVLWKIRNNAVHGLSVADNEIELGIMLAGSLLTDLKRKESNLNVRLPTSTLEIYRDAAGKFRWRFRAPNGEILVVSEAYESKEGCRNGIESLRRNFPEAKIRELTET